MTRGGNGAQVEAREQIDAAADLAELKRIELQVALLGAVTRRAIQRVARVSSHTVADWKARGLRSFRPGTSAELFLVADLQAFIGRGESFPGKKTRRRPKASA
jgi:hypothetical protein